jgi:phosphoglycolate phosphatase-like HAD superfamily hydrolase
VWDVAAAQRAGHPAIGLLCGGFGAGELLEAGASEVYDDPQDLVERIDQSLLSGR